MRRPDFELDAAAPVSGAQYSLIRFFLGGYLLVHFLHLLPWGAELFSAAGVFPATLSPLMGILPNPLSVVDTPAMVSLLLSVGAACGLALALGYRDRLAALAGALILGWLYARNPLIANPSLPVVGWLLIMHLFVPRGAFASWHARGDAEAWSKWHLPNGLWLAAWVMLAVAYTYSGYTKLLSPSWLDGSAIERVLSNPLARDHVLREWLLSMPVVLKLLTWTVMWIEVLFIVLALWRPTRLFAWLTMLLIQFGFLTFLNFADLTFPMLLIHALTFDYRWLGSNRRQQTEPAQVRQPILFFDGYCAFCNATVRFVLAEDQRQDLLFAPQDHPMFEGYRGDCPEDDSIVLVTPRGRTQIQVIGRHWPAR